MMTTACSQRVRARASTKNPVAAALLLAVALLTTLGWTGESWGQAKLPRVGIVANRMQDPMFAVAERALASRGWINGKTVALNTA